MVEVTIRPMQFHRTVALSFLWGKFRPEILTGFHRAGRQTRGWENKPFSSFKRQYFENGRRCVLRTKLLLVANRKSYFRLTPRSMTL